MENNVETCETMATAAAAAAATTVSTSSQVPLLSRLATEKIAELVELDELPMFDHPLLPSYSNEIVKILGARKKLRETLRRLRPDRFKITKMDLMGGGFTLDDVRHVYGHDLHYLKIGDIESFSNHHKIQIEEVLKAALNRQSRRNLKHLDLSGRYKISSSWPMFVALNLPHLESLSFANRNTSNLTLLQIGQQLTQLRYLDISNTYVTEISCIAGMKNLEVLIMYNLNILKGDVAETLSNFSKLRVLDISRKVNSDYLQETSQDAHGDVALGIYNRSIQAIKCNESTPWPELRALDMSGLSIVQFGTDRALEFVHKIIEAHPKLEQIALLATPLDSQTVEFPDRKLNVINSASRKSILFALSHYVNRESCRSAFTAHALHSVYYCLQSGYDKFTQEELGECIRLVCLSMQKYLTTLAVQIAGSACLYHICKLKRIKRLSVKDVCNCIERSLDAAEQYRTMTQLQKNVWLTICNDYLLHLEGIDFYRTCKVALDTMISNRDASVERMTIAIISIVTPKMKPNEAQMLTSDTIYIRHLVKIMAEYLDNYQRENLAQNRESDNTLYTLKFTLSALWNLTDECETTCRAFYDVGGVQIAFKILIAFSAHGNVQTKVLGILNNVAEVDEIKHSIINDESFVNLLLDCLEGDFESPDNKGRYRDVERSYFAGGILANLLCETTPWRNEELRNEVCEKLMESIEQWPELPSAMVSYRSLTPFSRILERSEANGAIMWCLWGVHHVLHHRDKTKPAHCSLGYVDMVQSSNILLICERMQKQLTKEPRVANLARKIVDIVEANERDETY
ncbi:unnamed protein product [Caenorhabditis bovis]|uniref:Uncharacterized protein n=1 Tax=Caenorhabditis bovis TaxID=2654633 RepID=A0A8S1F068_9PELO|nr:unnamed protein product [Caenorhabditis bovis]